MARRRYTREFKLSAVKLVNEQGYSPAEAAKSLGVDASSIRDWIEKYSAEAAPSGEGAMAAELRRLRRENARLLMEREILKKLGRQSLLEELLLDVEQVGLWIAAEAAALGAGMATLVQAPTQFSPSLDIADRQLAIADRLQAGCGRRDHPHRSPQHRRRRSGLPSRRPAFVVAV